MFCFFVFLASIYFVGVFFMFKYAVSIRYFASGPVSACYVVVAKDRYEAIHLALADLNAVKVSCV